MKKIVLITEVMEKGVGKHIIDLFSFFSEDTESDILVLYGAERVDSQFQKIIDDHKDKFIKINYLKRSIGLGDIKSIFEIAKILKEVKPDIVHCHSSKAGLAGRIAAKLEKVKNIYYSPHAYFFLKYKNKSLKRFIFKIAEKILSKRCTTCTIATSKGEKEAFINSGIDKNEKCILIEHGIQVPKIEDKQIQEYKEKFNIHENQVVIGAMARLEQQKDPITTITVMQNIVKKNENTVCILFGNGSMHETILEKYNHIQDSYKDRIIIAGETEEPELAIVMMDIYLTTSLYEGLPYTLLTALGYGKPILATNVEGNKDCVIDSVNGFLFEVGDVTNAVKCYEKMTEQKELLVKMGKESKNIYQERFSMEQMKHTYKKLYMEETNE